MNLPSTYAHRKRHRQSWSACIYILLANGMCEDMIIPMARETKRLNYWKNGPFSLKDYQPACFRVPPTPANEACDYFEESVCFFSTCWGKMGLLPYWKISWWPKSVKKWTSSNVCVREKIKRLFIFASKSIYPTTIDSMNLANSTTNSTYCCSQLHFLWKWQNNQRKVRLVHYHSGYLKRIRIFVTLCVAWSNER